jgi:ABC-2 type transport system permease protein
MNNSAQAIWVEVLKARRSKMPIFTILGFSILPMVGGFFMIILKDPEMARQVGLISVKAQITAGAADWPAFLDLLTMGIAVGGIILFSLIGIWVFGREFADRTAKDLLALPTSRSSIVFAKFIVIGSWSLALVLLICVLGLGVGMAVGLPEVSTMIIMQGIAKLAITAILTLAVVPPIVFFASAGHGYLPPMGVAILVIVLAQVVAIIGWGEYFPWSIPGILAQGDTLGWVSYLIVILTGSIGIAGTFVWWERADQTR